MQSTLDNPNYCEFGRQFGRNQLSGHSPGAAAVSEMGRDPPGAM